MLVPAPCRWQGIATAGSPDIQRWLERAGSSWATAKPTLIFDKGNNSAENFALVDTLELPYVGSVKLDEHPELMKISNQDARWQALSEPGLEGTKTRRRHSNRWNGSASRSCTGAICANWCKRP